MPSATLESPAPVEGYGSTLPGLERYAAAVTVTVLAVLSQYFVPQAVPGLRVLYGSFVGDLFVVYGVPILAFALLVGLAPLRRAFAHPLPAAVQGLRWYGALSILSLVVALGLLIAYELLDPGAISLLERANPVLRSAAGDPWFWVAFSFAIGAVEETIFRGWVFGYWLARGTATWEVHAVWTSALFAGVHAYYGLTYGVASPIPYSELFLLGLAFACIVRYSGGNLLVPALLHGAHDSTAFLTLLSPTAAAALQWGLVLVGGLVALLYALASREPTPRWLPPPPPAPAPPPFGGYSTVADPYAYLATGQMAPPAPPAPGPPPGFPPPPPGAGDTLP